jgi:NAD+ synthase
MQKREVDLHAWLEIDTAEAIDGISRRMREIVGDTLRKKGAVVAVSGGIDSSVCAAMAVRALGASRVLALILPEVDSSPESRARGELLCRRLGVQFEVADITPILSAFGCYRWRDEAIRSVFPGFGPEWKSKIVLSGSPLAGDRMNFFKVVVRSPAGELKEKRLPLEAYLQVVAATNIKQRTRKMLEYFHADRLNYAVVGTPNRLEYDQGFFVKNGDGAADLKPIAHLYKTQVYALAGPLSIPEEIRTARPTTDTYSLEQGQDEFFFALPYDTMDLVLYGLNHGMATALVAEETGLTVEQVERVFQDIRTKRRTTRPLHMKPVLMEPVPEIDGQ